MKLSEQNKELYKTIRTILWDDWDPIGVKGFDGAEDEYDGYIGEIFSMVVNDKATVIEISERLLLYTCENIGIDMPRVKSLEIAIKIVAAKEANNLKYNNSAYENL